MATCRGTPRFARAERRLIMLTLLGVSGCHAGSAPPMGSFVLGAIAPPSPTSSFIAPGSGATRQLATPTPSPTASPVSFGASSGGGGEPPEIPAPTPAPIGLAPCAGASDPAGVVTTLAGGTYGFADGGFLSAQFRSPRGMASDASGRLYVADTGNRALRLLMPNGTVSTLAGGPGSTTFQEPVGVAVDASGTVYVGDTGTDTILRVSAQGSATVLAGSGAPGIQDGVGTAARFDDPRGIALDAANDLYVADLNNHRIREVAPDGTVTTFAGSSTTGAADGQGTQATFTSPIGVALDASGDVYVADIGTNSIRKITPAGAVTTFAGSGAPGDTDGQGAAAQFNEPWAITCDPRGVLYVLDGPDASRLRRITPGGLVSTLAGSTTAGYQNGTGIAARFFSAFSLTANGCGRLLVTDGFCRVREVQ